MLKVLIVLFVASAFVGMWYLSDIRRLMRDFPSREPFNGALVRSPVRFALADYSADCAIGANSDGLYIASAITAFKRLPWWTGGYMWGGVYMVRRPLFIPWDSLQYSESKPPMRGYIRFDVPSLRIGRSAVCFFIRREIGVQLLSGVGRQVSS